jgi:hypothetical protein
MNPTESRPGRILGHPVRGAIPQPSTRRPAVWCRTKEWPLPNDYARCPYCGLWVEPKLHPDYPGLPDECYARPD